MIKIRLNTFETNSSSTHSLVMCTDSEYDKWAKGEIYYCRWFPHMADESLKKKDHFYTKEEAKAICASAGIIWDDEQGYDCRERKEYFYTLDEFCESDYLEVEEYSYTTPGGETVRAVAKYGYDG